mmetsp:Transcript_26722/g.77012  ORF Transcript_26722/g.77012 Transcript_26722/m.77012 type:complete len:225 (-) Transcript_26722:918-1592(-)
MRCGATCIRHEGHMRARQGSYDSPHEAADQHCPREVAARRRHTSEADVEASVGAQREQRVHRVDHPLVSAREQQVHGALRGGEQQRRHRVVVAARAVVADQLARVSRSQGLAPAPQCDQSADGRADGRIQDGFADFRIGLASGEGLHGRLPPAPDSQADPGVDGAEGAEDASDEDHHRQVPPIPRVSLRTPLVEHKGLDVGTTPVQQGLRQQSAEDGACECPEG